MAGATREQLTQLLANYLERVPALKEAWIFDRDGLVIAGGGRDQMLAPVEGDIPLSETFGALAGTIESSLSRIRSYNIGSFGTGMFESDEYRLVFIEAGAQAIFLSVLAYEAETDKAMPYAYLVAEKIASILGEETTELFLEIPDFEVQFNESFFADASKDGDLTVSNVKSQNAVFKLIVLGDEKVGKTTLINSFVTKKFNQNYMPTIGISITSMEFHVQGFKDVMQKFLIFDIAGQKFFKRVRSQYYKGAHAAFIMYDVTNQDTFKNLQLWYDDLTQNLPHIPIIVVGNKIDLKDDRAVPFADGQAFAREHRCSFIETSAKTGENVKEVFHILGIGLFFTTP
ncbi:MAG TPA: GTP-binding protein [Candidatus Lokiarchaeia archaeon]|nr:GTP-binding protein [Candidatus Lokiarchaeia archaeon]